MPRSRPELTDSDLRRLVRLGGSVERIAEAAGIGWAEARRRLAAPDLGMLQRPADPSVPADADGPATASV